MSYPDPYHPQQQPPPGTYGYGYPPNGGYPPGQPYTAQPQPPYYPSPPVPPQPADKRNDGNSWGWQFLEALIDLFSGSTSHGLGKNARARVKTALLIFGITFGGIVLLVLILAWTSR